MVCFEILSWEVVILKAPLWIFSLILGVMVGWMWRPNWASLVKNEDSAKAANSLSFGFIPNFSFVRIPLSIDVPWISDYVFGRNGSSGDTNSNMDSSVSSANVDSQRTELVSSVNAANSEKTVAFSSVNADSENSDLVGDDEIQHLCRLVEETDGGPAWSSFFKKTTPTMSYQAWRRDPETGPFQCRSKTVFEDVTPELVRDFFWDDEFRKKWDDLLIHSSILEECPVTGTMLVHWIRKFPLFLSNREYSIARRIWESGRSYYCVTKAVPCSAIPRRKKPRRVEVYYSSWFIRSVESMSGNGQMTATEVTLFHHEDTGIPNELANLGMKKGMWLVVKKIEPGLRAYQQERVSGSPISHSAFMAQINTKVRPEFLNSSENSNNSSNSLLEADNSDSSNNERNKNIRKFVIIGGAIVIVCSLDRGLLTKALLFGAARRLARKVCNS